MGFYLMSDDDYKELDNIIADVLNRLAQNGNSNCGIIRLYNFSFKNENHLGLLNIAMIASTLNYKIEINTNPIAYFIYSRKYKLNKSVKYTNKKVGMDTSTIIKLFEKKYNKPEIFEKIYTVYYKTKRKVGRHGDLYRWRDLK